MTRLSSGSTFFFKRVFPVVWFGFLGVMSVVLIAAGVVEKAPAVLLSPLFMAVIGFVVTKTLLWDLMDEVIDQGDALLIRNGAETETVPLTKIMNVSLSTLVNPPRVTLRLVQPCRFGQEVVFSPAVGIRLNPFARVKSIDDLVVRVDQARTRRMG